MAGIGGAGRDVFAPELGEPRLKEAIDHRRNTLTDGLWGDKAAPDIKELFVGQPLVAPGNPLQPGPGTEPIQREQEPILEGGPIEVFPGRGTPKEAGKIDT